MNAQNKNTLSCPVQTPKLDVVCNTPLRSGVTGSFNSFDMKIIMELPYYSMSGGGVRDSLLLAKSYSPKMAVRFNHIKCGFPDLDLEWSVGIPDNTFPECDIAITYSDTPHLDRLVSLPQVKNVFIMMLSYGMAPDRERRNVLNKKVTVLCSSKKIEEAIIKEGVNVCRLGIGLDMSQMFNNKIQRKRYLAILYHDMPSKKYDVAVKAADILFAQGIIDGVITFGRHMNYNKFQHPKGLIEHIINATPKQINEIFNICKCFLMPSTTEGINLTPIESTLCGCPAIICDGAIGEVFFDKDNCFVVPKDDVNGMVNSVSAVMKNFNYISPMFQSNMEISIKDMNWSNVIEKLKEVL